MLKNILFVAGMLLFSSFVQAQSLKESNQLVSYINPDGFDENDKFVLITLSDPVNVIGTCLWDVLVIDLAAEKGAAMLKAVEAAHKARKPLKEIGFSVNTETSDCMVESVTP